MPSASLTSRLPTVFSVGVDVLPEASFATAVTLSPAFKPTTGREK